MVTTQQYGEELARLVAMTKAEFPQDLAEVQSWEDLHGVCDANEYLIDANEKLGVDFDGTGIGPNPDAIDDADRYNRFANDSIAIAESILGWEGGPR